MGFVSGHPSVSCINARPMLWTVDREPKMFISMYARDGQPLYSVDRKSGYEHAVRKPRGLQLNRLANNVTVPALTLEEYFPEHLQYICDTLAEQETKIADALNLS